MPAKELTFISLFAGIPSGGMDLGLERAGLRCVGQVEIDPFARRVLAKHWPHVRRHDDVRTFPPGDPDEWRCDIIAGGFPCQDISNAGKRVGIEGPRSGLWNEFVRVVRTLRPSLVLVENVSAMLVRGLDRVLGDLASLGFDAEWACLPASSVGAAHVRDRLFVFAYGHGERLRGGRRAAFACPPRSLPPEAQEWDGLRLDVRTMGERSAARARTLDERVRQPDALRTGNGLPGRLDGDRSRRRAIGNAVYPDVAEWIGRRIREVASC